MSNSVYIVSGVEKKMIIRFFESEAADFALENRVFEISSAKKYAPDFVESDGSSYRVEDYFEGQPLRYDQLLEPEILQKTMQKIALFNYDQDLMQLGSQVPMLDRMGEWLEKAASVLEKVDAPDIAAFLTKEDVS